MWVHSTELRFLFSDAASSSSFLFSSFLEEPSVGRVATSVTSRSTAMARPSSASQTSLCRTGTRATMRKPIATTGSASTMMRSARISLAPVRKGTVIQEM